MLKFGGTRNLYEVRKRRERHEQKSEAEISTVRIIHHGLESPKTISLEDLRALVPRSGLESPPSLSLECLRELLPFSESSHHNSSPEIQLDDLREILEPAGIVTRQEVEVTTRDFLASDPRAPDEKTKFRLWKVVPENPTSEQCISSPIVNDEEKVQNPKVDNTRSEISSPVPKVKVTPKSSRQEENIEKLNGPESFLQKLEELSEGDNLEKWIANLNLPKEMDLPQIREQIQTFLKERTWEKHGGLRFGIMDSSLAQRLWYWFKDLSIAKQILIVIGLSVVIVAIGFLTAQLLSLLWPSLLGVATSGEAALREIGVEAFKQRQEPAFNLLHIHAEQAKPMSYAWANQYVLWKYCR